MSAPRQTHRTGRSGWLRAAVLGANDGILSTASLVLGVAAAHGTHQSVLVAGGSGLLAGAMAMASGEFVSVHSQADTEAADIALERIHLEDHEAELKELADIYVGRGLTPTLAAEVAAQLMAHDALAAHARDELGITDELKARPGQAAIASAISFSGGALLPLLTCILTPLADLIPSVAVASLFFLALLGALAARSGGAPVLRSALRVSFWGAAAMATTAIAGTLFGTYA
jgi:VIT1/CCC1 family predicted Fe2+/Mn2+ transporter